MKKEDEQDDDDDNAGGVVAAHIEQKSKQKPVSPVDRVEQMLALHESEFQFTDNAEILLSSESDDKYGSNNSCVKDAICSMSHVVNADIDDASILLNDNNTIDGYLINDATEENTVMAKEIDVIDTTLYFCQGGC